MDINKSNKNKLIYIITFVVLNLLNSFLLTTNLILENLDPFPRTVFMMINSFFGDFGFFLLFLGLAILLFKTDYGRALFIMYISILLGFIYFGLSVYLQHYNMFFSFYNLSAFGSQGGGDAVKFIIDSLLLLLTSAKFIFLASPALIVILFIILFRKYRKTTEFRKYSIITGKNRVIIGFGIFIMSILIMASSLSAFRVEIEDTWYEDNSTALYGAQTVGLFNYYIYEGYSYLTHKHEGIHPDKVKSIKEKLDTLKVNEQISLIDGKKYPISDYYGIYEGKNLILIQLESFNNFVIGLNVEIDGKIVEITPNLNRIANESIYFSNYFTSVGIGNTSDSEFTSLTGLYPIGNDYIIYDHDDVEYPTLAKMFKEKGYSTYSSHANTGKFYERKRVHETVYGFDKHYAKEDLNVASDKLLHTWLSDYEFLMQNADIYASYANSDQNVFSFLITITAHMPYSKPSESKGVDWFFEKKNFFPEGFMIVENPILNQQILGYLEHIAYVDYAIGKFIDKIDELGLSDDTVIAFYGDHGCDIDAFQMFYESKDKLYNRINPMINEPLDEQTKILFNRRFMANIPFIIYEATKEEKLIEPMQVDLVRGTSSTARTLANLFGLKPQYYFGVDGLSDVPTFIYNPKNFDIYADGIIISGQSKRYAILEEEYVNYYTDEVVQKVIDSFYKYKDFNDKLIRYKIFPQRQK